LESNRDGRPTHILLVGIDSRDSKDAGLPDSLTLINLEQETLLPISRSWEYSIIEQGEKLVPFYLGVETCEPFCGVKGLYAFSKLGELENNSDSQALDTLARVVEREYSIPSLAFVAFDLARAQGILSNLAPIEVSIAKPVPVGGQVIDGKYTDIRRYIPLGKKSLGGEDAFWFARARHGTSNNDRIARQMALVEAIAQQKSFPQIAFATLASSGMLMTDLTIWETASIAVYFQPHALN